MDLMEAKGYLQAVADNWNDAPKAQKAIQTVLDYVDFCYDEQNRLVEEIAEQHRLIADLSDELSQRNLTIESLNDALASVFNEFERVLSTNEALKKELVDERYRHDRMADFTVGQSRIIDELRAGKCCIGPGCAFRMEVQDK